MEISRPFSSRKCRCQNQKSRLLICFFECEGKVCQDSAPQSQMVKQKFNLQVLGHLRVNPLWGRSCSPTSGHHDSVPSFRVLSIMQILAKNYYCLGIPCLLTRSHSVWLLPVPYHEESSPGIRSWNHGGNSEGCDGCSKQLSEELLLKVRWQFETVLIFMYSCRRKLLGKRPVQFRIKLIQCSIYQTFYYCPSLICVFKMMTLISVMNLTYNFPCNVWKWL